MSYNNDPILERATPPTLLERKRLEIAQAKTWDDLRDAFLGAFTAKKETTLFDRLMAGEFNELPSKDFVAMVNRIFQEEGKALASMYDAICAYLEDNEPLNGYNVSSLSAA